MQIETDAELVRRARTGDKHAFGELITRHQRTTDRVAYHMVRDRELARDLTQEALLAAYLSLKQLRDDARFGSWLYGITLNLCRNRLRERNNNTLSFEEITGGVAFQVFPFSGDPDPQTLVETRELHERVMEGINTLSEENRAATLLFYYDSLSLDEIAAVLHITVGAVKGRLHKSRRQLRRELFDAFAEFAPRVSTPERSLSMIPVTVANVVLRERKDEHGNVFPQYIIVLYDKAGQRTLPIWVGPFEGRAIAIGVMGEAMPRPMTFEFIAKLLDAAGAKIESVRVDSLQGDVFYSVVTLRHGSQNIEIDARPSDAIALAVRTNSPILVTAELMDKSALAIPQPITIHSPPRGIEQLSEAWQQEYQAGLALARSSAQDWGKSQHELIETVFGA